MFLNNDPAPAWMTAMRSFEPQLRLYRLLVENSLGLMCVHDLDGVLLTINPAAAQSLGYCVDDSLGRNIRDFLVPSVRHLFDDYLQRIRRNPIDSGLMRLRAKDGNERVWLYRNVRHEEPGAPVLVLGHALDITDRITAERALKQSQSDLASAREELERRVADRTSELQQTNERLMREIEQRKLVEEELLRARKLEAIGRFAGGIAHDFNNLMTIVLGYCDSLRSSLASRDLLQGQLNEISKAAEQANALTRQLLAFSRRQRLQPSVLKLNAVVTEMSNMLHRLLNDDIDFVIVSDPSLAPILANRGQIEQVILNLVINAAQAMPRGGRLVVTVNNTELDGVGRPPTEYHQGRLVHLSVSDTGVGMKPEVKARIFDPFFTTKDSGEGTGLGLATVYGIVKEANGHITVESEAGKGTTFHLYFPMVQEQITLEAKQETVSRRSSRGSETVLVVDDQEGLRILLHEILRNNGYRVLSAANGSEALSIAGDRSRHIDLVITDMVMPRMGGRELAEALRDSQPEAKILCMSGYTERTDEIDELLLRGHSYIDKPFTPEALLQTIREVLDRAAVGIATAKSPRRE